MKTLSIVFAAALATLAPSAALAQRHQVKAATQPQAEAAEEVSLAVGETKTLSAKNVKNYSEGVAGVVDVKLTTDGANFIVNGRKPGTTTLLLIFDNGTQHTINLNVFAQSPAAVEKELTQLLEGIEGVHVRRVGAHTVIDGRVSNEADAQRVQQIASLYPGQVQSLVTAGGGVVLAPSGNGTTEQRYLIRIDFYFVQYDKNSSYGVGVGWPASVGGDNVLTSQLALDGLTGTARTATATLTNQPLPRLDIASRHGWAKVLKQATIVTSNGVNATFENGGEQLYSVTQGLTVGVQKVQFGAEVTVLPTYNPDTKNLDVKLNADVSDLTSAASGSTLPGRITSKLQTQISLKLGQALVLSGIRSKSQTTTRSGLPGLSDIPILGFLFGSHSNSELETEGAIFIVPSVITTAATMPKEMVDTALAKFRDYSGDVEDVEAYRKNPGDALDVPGKKK